MQRSFKEGSDGDDQISDPLHEKIKIGNEDVQRLSIIKVSRWIGASGEGNGYHLHLLTDSSEAAHGNCVLMEDSVSSTRRLK